MISRLGKIDKLLLALAAFLLLIFRHPTNLRRRQDTHRLYFAGPAAWCSLDR